MDSTHEPMLTAKDVAERLNLRNRKTGELRVKRVYELPIRKTKLPGVGVRYTESDLSLYINLHAA